MQNKKYIILNGRFISDDSFFINRNNRAFKYGDSIFETMFSSSGKVRFFENHYRRITSGMKKLGYEKILNQEKIKEEILKLIRKNKYLKGIRIRLTIFRKSGGFYTPETNNFNYLIETSELENEFYKLNKNGLIIDIYNEIKKPINKLSYYKTGNSLLFILAGIYKKKQKFDDCIILNEKNNICETISSNIFIIKNKNIITPAKNEACVSGIMRNFVIKNAGNFAYKIIEKNGIKTKDLFNAEEIFITNAVTGIKWIAAFKDKKYPCKKIKKLSENLNSILF